MLFGLTHGVLREAPRCFVLLMPLPDFFEIFTILAPGPRGLVNMKLLIHAFLIQQRKVGL